MKLTSSFKAPWGTGVKVSTAAMSAALLGGLVLTFMWAIDEEIPGVLGVAMAAMPLYFLLRGAVFMVLGYEVVPGMLRVHCLGGVQEVPLNDLQSVKADPRVMSRPGQILLTRIPGVFGDHGWLYSQELGQFQSFVTDRARSVVMRFTEKAIVVSPDRPEEFQRALETSLQHFAPRNTSRPG